MSLFFYDGELNTMIKYIELKTGDNDKRKKWGGKVRLEAPDYTIDDLQKDLKSVGVYHNRVDGDFGRKTEMALKIFQWTCANIEASIKNGIKFARLKNISIIVTGKLNKPSLDELSAWVSGKQVTTGDLIRVSFSSFTNIEAGSGFKKINSAKVATGEMVISTMALPLLKEMNKIAKAKDITIVVNQVFRELGVAVTGAVVSPAKKSQHLIGHAIDCNIVDGSNWNNSATFKSKKETQKAKDFIKEIKAEGYRWGGNFSKADSPHFDNQLEASSFAYDAKIYLNQYTISKGQDILKVSL